ncbi:Thioredoxin domain-containing protein [Spironucleus salmonicida]|uniref:Thioredoxin domain-containing protein n=1 Tax=Spironucleus salmonicida TaxID=348837 RepID=V6LMT9_9EUKA|nr:Thioredoxin domain-containing protein [Spironucleus salmonicida]|eukprot:EST46002.1 Thioredoxin domain-containing protein [Spironucleus salmonicida]
MLVLAVCFGLQGYRAVNYAPQKTALQAIQELKPTKILLFHAKWCGDCQKHVPFISNIFSQLQTIIPQVEINQIEVDYNKQDQNGLTKQFKITKIPTIIILRGKHLCKLTEYPKVTWEDDMADCF